MATEGERERERGRGREAAEAERLLLQTNRDTDCDAYDEQVQSSVRLSPIRSFGSRRSCCRAAKDREGNELFLFFFNSVVLKNPDDADEDAAMEKYDAPDDHIEMDTFGG